MFHVEQKKNKTKIKNMIIEHIIEGRKFTFACHTWETRNAWGHEVHLHRDCNEISKARVRYYNRTWERYQYQSACIQAVNNAIDDRKDSIKTLYKMEHNKSRVPSKIFDELCKNDSYLQIYEKLKQALQ